MKKSTIEKILLILLFTAIACITLYNYQISPLLLKIQEQNSEIMTLDNEYKNLSQYSGKENDIKNSIEKYNNDLEIISTKLPDENNKVAITSYFYEQIKKYNLVGKNIRFEDTSHEFKGFYLYLFIEGEKDMIKNILLDIENNPPRLMNIHHISMSDTGVPNISALNLKIAIYTHKNIENKQE